MTGSPQGLTYGAGDPAGETEQNLHEFAPNAGAGKRGNDETSDCDNPGSGGSDLPFGEVGGTADPYLRPLDDEEISKSVASFHPGVRHVAYKRNLGSVVGKPHVDSDQPRVEMTENSHVDEKVSTLVSSLDSEASTCGQDDDPRVDKGVWRVDYVRSSEGTYAFRLRLVDGRKKGKPSYVSWVSTKAFTEIRGSDYEQFKQGIIAEYTETI